MSSMFSVRCFAAIAIALTMGTGMAEERRPNLVVIYGETAGGDLFDPLGNDGAGFKHCLAPGGDTEDLASLLSGCHEFRAGVTHRRGGREFIRPDVPLISEAFKAAGYHTAFFGRWGLGEALPFRPEDRGFETILVQGGSEMGFPGDRWGNSDTDPWLRNRKGWAQYKGDAETTLSDEAIKWMNATVSAETPFYLQLNLPPGTGWGASKILKELDRLGLKDQTVVTQVLVNRIKRNDANWVVHWPGHVKGRRIETRQIAVFDVFPTLAGLCRVPMFRDWTGDGIDLSRWVLGGDASVPERTFFTHWPGWPSEESPDRQKSKNFAVLTSRWKLEGLTLTDLTTGKAGDFESNPEVVSDLLTQYGKWWQSVRPALVDPSRIIVGDDRQKVVPLTWGDWWPSREDTNAKGSDDYLDHAALRNLLGKLADPSKSKEIPSISGHWKLHANQSGHYMVTLRKIPEEASEEERTRLGQFKAGFVHVRAGKFEVKTQLLNGATAVSLGVDLNEGPIELEAWTEGQIGEGKILGAFFASVERVGERKMPDPDWKVRPK